MDRKPDQPLRRGWTTGACATAATQAALTGLWSGTVPRTSTVTMPRGEEHTFDIHRTDRGPNWVRASVIKDAGDDPDVTHGAEIVVRVAPSSGGIVFAAGEGVGTVTRAGLPVPVGAPAINPVPRQMMTGLVEALARQFDRPADVEITISVTNGAALALKTWNPRLGIEGGLSILGTTGIVRPFSCAAWIASIHRGIDVARAAGLIHVAGCTGATSERVVQAELGLPDHAMLDMGDFAGGVLKYLDRHPVARLTIGGGAGKLAKLAQGAMDLHSGRSQVNFEALAALAADVGGDAAAVRKANTVMEAVGIVPALSSAIARAACEVAQKKAPDTVIDVIVVSRDGRIAGRST